MRYIYLLHFDSPLSHAMHYIGCTDNLVARLRDHAIGHGADITRACREAKIGWRLTRLWYGHFGDEHALKAKKNAKMYCPKCNPYPACFQKKDDVPIDLLNIPTASQDYANLDRLRELTEGTYDADV